MSISLLTIGFILTIGGAHFVVESASSIARMFGVSEWVIGLFLISLGTSLPELVVSLVAVKKGHADMSIGNIIGSNIFNLLGVLGIAATLRPVEVLPIILARDFPIMFLITGAWYLMASDFRGPGRIGRRSGSVLLAMFIGYFIMVWMSSGATNPLSAG